MDFIFCINFDSEQFEVAAWNAMMRKKKEKKGKGRGGERRGKKGRGEERKREKGRKKQASKQAGGREEERKDKERKEKNNFRPCLYSLGKNFILNDCCLLGCGRGQ